VTEVVYVIGSSESDLAKIGRSGNITQRLGAIQRMCPIGLNVLWNTEGGHKLETALHQTFRSRRVHGEWFDFRGCDPVVEVAAAAADIKGKELQPAYEVDDTYLTAGQLFGIATMPRAQSREFVGQVRSFNLVWYRRLRNRGLRSVPNDVSGFIIARAVVAGLLTPEDLKL